MIDGSTLALRRRTGSGEDPSLARVIARHRILTEWSDDALAQALSLIHI